MHYVPLFFDWDLFVRADRTPNFCRNKERMQVIGLAAREAARPMMERQAAASHAYRMDV